MPLSYELISQFAKLAAGDKRTAAESTVYGTIKVDENGNKYVKLDGTDQLTPLADDEHPSVDSTSVNANADERVSVLIKNHTATVTGNISFPAARNEDVENLGDQVSEIQKFDILIGEQLQAQEAYLEQLQVDKASVAELQAATAKISELESKKASIEELNAAKAEITDLKATKLDAEVANVKYATIENLTATNLKVTEVEAKHGEYEQLTAENFKAVAAEISKLNVDKLDVTWANIDFANIDAATIGDLFARSGIIEDLVVDNGSIAGTLTAVDINADYIKTGTLKAARLILLGEDGLFHEINVQAGQITEGEAVPDDGIHGSVIAAKSITATQIRVEDLVAFGATIGGFHIGANSLYSGVKESIDNSTRGFYVDTDGQIYLGDADSYIRYYKTTDEEGNEVYRLGISADSILFGADSKSSAADLKALTEHVKIGTIKDEQTGDEKPCVELSEGDSDFKQIITNTETRFVDGDAVKTRINADGVHSDNITVKDELRHGKWVWATRKNGNYGLTWKEG